MNMTIEEILQHDLKFRYMWLARLRTDCKYYLSYGNRCPKCLWAGNEKEQIETMTRIYESFQADEKPEWLTMEDIREYGRQMLSAWF